MKTDFPNFYTVHITVCCMNTYINGWHTYTVCLTSECFINNGIT